MSYLVILVLNGHSYSNCTIINLRLKSVFLISSYGAQLAQRASYLALHSFLFGPDSTVNYNYIVTNSINSLLICIPNGAHTNHC